MPEEFVYQMPLPLGDDKTEYRLITKDYVSTALFKGRKIIVIDSDGLTVLAEEAFRDVSHLYRKSHLRKLANILDDPESSDYDRYVALELLKNAVISAEMEFPMCQDTGTAIIIGRKGQQVWTGLCDEEALSKGVFLAYTKNNFRYSQNAPLSMFEEKNTTCNLPAQIDLYASGDDTYEFLFIAKGGGSANKTFLYQESNAILNKGSLLEFMGKKLKTLGTSACPPYHLAFVVGGTSPEANLRTVKLASAGYLDQLPTSGNKWGQAFRDRGLEENLLKMTQSMGIGAQFGGKYFCLDVRVIRLPRHGGSCPIGLGVSCSADRNIKAKISSEGIFLEKLERNPAQFLPEPKGSEGVAVAIDLEQSMDEIRAKLTQYPVSTRVMLNGELLVARDIAHAKLKTLLDGGDELPQYFKDYIIYYAGPAKTPNGYASGSFGPTTAARMDPYVDLFQQHGGSMIMLGKGNRSVAVRDACKKYGGFYLGSIGGTAARLGKECIKNIEILEYPELGMEAIYKIEVKEFPAFIIIDDKGNDFFLDLL